MKTFVTRYVFDNPHRNCETIYSHCKSRTCRNLFTHSISWSLISSVLETISCGFIFLFATSVLIGKAQKKIINNSLAKFLPYENRDIRVNSKFELLQAHSNFCLIDTKYLVRTAQLNCLSEHCCYPQLTERKSISTLTFHCYYNSSRAFVPAEPLRLCVIHWRVIAIKSCLKNVKKKKCFSISFIEIYSIPHFFFVLTKIT